MESPLNTQREAFNLHETMQKKAELLEQKRMLEDALARLEKKDQDESQYESRNKEKTRMENSLSEVVGEIIQLEEYMDKCKNDVNETAKHQISQVDVPLSNENNIQFAIVKYDKDLSSVSLMHNVFTKINSIAWQNLASELYNQTTVVETYSLLFAMFNDMVNDQVARIMMFHDLFTETIVVMYSSVKKIKPYMQAFPKLGESFVRYDRWRNYRKYVEFCRSYDSVQLIELYDCEFIYLDAKPVSTAKFNISSYDRNYDYVELSSGEKMMLDLSFDAVEYEF